MWSWVWKVAIRQSSWLLLRTRTRTEALLPGLAALGTLRIALASEDGHLYLLLPNRGSRQGQGVALVSPCRRPSGHLGGKDR